MADALRKLAFQTNLYSMMAGCFYFITYKWDIFGWHISLMNAIIVAESFELVMHFIGRMFGKEEVIN